MQPYATHATSATSTPSPDPTRAQPLRSRPSHSRRLPPGPHAPRVSSRREPRSRAIRAWAEVYAQPGRKSIRFLWRLNGLEGERSCAAGHRREFCGTFMRTPWLGAIGGVGHETVPRAVEKNVKNHEGPKANIQLFSTSLPQHNILF